MTKTKTDDKVRGIIEKLSLYPDIQTDYNNIQQSDTMLDRHVEAWLEDREDSISDEDKAKLVDLVRREAPEKLDGCRTSASVSDTWEYIVNGDCEDLFLVED